MKNEVEFIREDDLDQNDNELKHYGVLGMKWGVRKEEDKASSMRGPISNKLYNFGNKRFFNEGIKLIKSSSSGASSLRSSGSKYVLKFEKTSFGKVKAWKGKKSSSKKKSGGGGGKKSKGGKSTKAKAEEALKEKIASGKAKGGSGKGSSGGSKGGSSKEGTKKEKKVSVDPDFDEKNFTPENKLGDTRFYAFINEKGKWVISDKEKKWLLPKGLTSKVTRGFLQVKLEQFEKDLEEILKDSDYEYTEEDMDTWTTAAIDKIISELKSPKLETNEKVAEVINKLLDVPEEDNTRYDIVPEGEDKKPENTKEESSDEAKTEEEKPEEGKIEKAETLPNKEYEDKSNTSKINENVSKGYKESEEKKKKR